MESRSERARLLAVLVLALLSGSFVYAVLKRRKALQTWHLMVGGIFYLLFLVGPSSSFSIVRAHQGR
jgi:hypothetical protein